MKNFILIRDRGILIYHLIWDVQETSLIARCIQCNRNYGILTRFFYY